MKVYRLSPIIRPIPLTHSRKSLLLRYKAPPMAAIPPISAVIGLDNSASAEPILPILAAKVIASGFMPSKLVINNANGFFKIAAATSFNAASKPVKTFDKTPTAAVGSSPLIKFAAIPKAVNPSFADLRMTLNAKKTSVADFTISPNAPRLPTTRLTPKIKSLIGLGIFKSKFINLVIVSVIAVVIGNNRVPISAPS